MRFYNTSRKVITLLLFCILLPGYVYAQSGLVGGTAPDGGPVALKNGAKVIPPPQPLCLITTNSLPNATQDVFYSQTIQVSNCATPVTFSITAGALPTWVTTVWPNTTGKIEGTPGPSDGGTNTSFTVTATDANGHAATFNAGFNIAAAPSGGTAAPPDTALLNWDTSIAATPSPNTVITIGNPGASVCSLSGGICNFTPSQLSTAVGSLTCGQKLAMQDTLYQVAGSVTFGKVCDSGHWITIENDPTDTNFPPEGTRVTPCYAGIPYIPGYPRYPCPNPVRHMPLIQKTTAGATINIFGSFYRFQGIDWSHTNGYDLDFGELAMANQAACTAPDLDCMNAQPTFNVFDRNIIHGDAQKQTSHAIGLGGTRWVNVKDSYIYDINLTVSGGGGDAQPFAWGNGKNFTNIGWGKFTNNFESASTMGNLFCGSFAEPVSPSTGADGIPGNFLFDSDWLYKPLTWDTQRGQTQGTPLNDEGVSYPPAGDQEFLMSPPTMQLQTGQSITVQTWTANDSWGGIGRSPAGTTTLTCSSANCGSQTTICQGCGTANPIGVGSGIYVSAQFVTTYTAPATVPTGGTVTLTRSFTTFDGRPATIGNTRTLTASAVFTIVSGAPINQISLFPKAPDLQIQPSYSDAYFNVRQFELEFIAVKNFTSTGLTWKVDGITGGNSTVGQMCGLTSTTTCTPPGGNDPQAIYWSGTQTGNHTISVISAAGTTDSSIINVSTTAPIVAWDGKTNTSKNGFELKCGRKFKVTKMFIENDWGSNGNGNGQGGQLFLAHPFNQTNCPGNCKTSILSGSVDIGYGPFEIADGTFSFIKGLHHGAGMVIGGSQQTLGIRRVDLSHILCDDCSYKNNSHGFGLNTYFGTSFNSGPSTVLSWQSPTNPMASNISYDHVTDVGDVPVNNPARGGVFDVSENTGQAAVKPFGYSIKDSFWAANTSATFFDPNGGSTCNLAVGSSSNNTEARGMVPCFTSGGYTLSHLNLNDSTASPSVFISSPIWQFASNTIGFVNYNAGNGGDYRLCKGLNNPTTSCTGTSLFAAGQSQQASDGTDLGADAETLAMIEQNIRLGVSTGLPFSISTTSLPSATHNVAYSQTLAVTGGVAPYTWSTPANITPSGTLDVLDYFLMPLPDRNSFHLAGDAVKYFHLDNGIIWWMKGVGGNPWDGEMFDDNEVYQWITEGLTFGNASGYKKYVNPVPLWKRYHVAGADDVIYTPGPNKYDTTESCGADNLPQIDNLGVRGEETGPFTDIDWTTTYGGSIPNKTPYLFNQKWIKCTANNILNCQTEEDYWNVLGYGQVRWCTKHLSGGTYVTDQCSTNTTKTAGGAPTLNFACSVPALPIINSLPLGTASTSSPSLNLGESTGTISGTPTTTGIKVFTVQVEDAVGHIATKTFTLPVN